MIEDVNTYKQMLVEAGIEVPEDIDTIDELTVWLDAKERELHTKITPDVRKLRVIRGIRGIIEAIREQESS